MIHGTCTVPGTSTVQSYGKNKKNFEEVYCTMYIVPHTCTGRKTFMTPHLCRLLELSVHSNCTLSTNTEYSVTFLIKSIAAAAAAAAAATIKV